MRVSVFLLALAARCESTADSSQQYSSTGMDDAQSLIQARLRSQALPRRSPNASLLQESMRMKQSLMPIALELKHHPFAALCEGLSDEAACVHDGAARILGKPTLDADMVPHALQSPSLEPGEAEALRGVGDTLRRMVKGEVGIDALVPGTTDAMSVGPDLAMAALADNGTFINKIHGVIRDALSSTNASQPLGLIQSVQRSLQQSGAYSEAKSKAEAMSTAGTLGEKSGYDSTFLGAAIHLGPEMHWGVHAELALTFHFKPKDAPTEDKHRYCVTVSVGTEPTVSRVKTPTSKPPSNQKKENVFMDQDGFLPGYMGPGDPEVMPVFTVGQTKWDATKTGWVIESGGGTEINLNHMMKTAHPAHDHCPGVLQSVAGVKYKRKDGKTGSKGWFMDIALPECLNLVHTEFKPDGLIGSLMEPDLRKKVNAAFKTLKNGLRWSGADPEYNNFDEGIRDKIKIEEGHKFNILFITSFAQSWCYPMER